MADITRYPFFHHLRADTTAYVQHLRNGRVKHAGPGLAFWFRPRTAALAEIPLDDRDQALLFHARTADFQDVTVQATVNYRVTDPALAATRIDFGIAPETGQWNATPLETLGGLLTEFSWLLRRIGGGVPIALNPGWDIGMDFDADMTAQLVTQLPPEHSA